MHHKNPYYLVENNGFEPFASACKADVLAKYTNPPKWSLMCDSNTRNLPPKGSGIATNRIRD